MCTTNEMITGLKEVAKRNLPFNGRIYLYGSRARGDAKEDSDWDILILLDKEKISTEDFNNVAYPLVEFGWTVDADISPQLYTKAEWNKMSFMPYYKNVEHDKIVIV